jgi:hypothetical protein
MQLQPSPLPPPEASPTLTGYVRCEMLVLDPLSDTSTNLAPEMTARKDIYACKWRFTFHVGVEAHHDMRGSYQRLGCVLLATLGTGVVISGVT